MVRVCVSVLASTGLVVGLVPITPSASATLRPSSHRLVGPLPSAKLVRPRLGRAAVGDGFSWSRPAAKRAAVTVLSEARAKWSALTRVFNDAGGLVSIQQSTLPVNYHTGQGWVPIDNHVYGFSGGWVGTSDNSWTTRFGNVSQGVQLRSAAGGISLSPLGADRSAARSVAQPAKVATSPSALAAAPVPGRAKVSYAGAWPGVDLVDTVSISGVAVDLVLRDHEVSSTYQFEVSGSAMHVLTDGGVGFAGPLGKEFHILPPRVLDAKGHDVTAASGTRYTVEGTRLTVTLNRVWLASQPRAVFPITVDPQVNNQPMGSTVSFSNVNPNTPDTTDGLQVGVNGGTVWRGAAQFDLSGESSYVSSGYRVYSAHLTFSGFNCSCSAPSSSPMLVFDQGSQAPSSYSAVGAGDPLVQGPWNGAFVQIASDLDSFLENGVLAPWFSATADSYGYQDWNSQFPVTIFADLYLPPAPSRVLGITQGSILTNTQPTLSATQIAENPENQNFWRMYDYQITTGDTPGAGLVIDSGELCQQPAGGGAGSACQPGTTGVPTWQVPPGELADGVTYHAWVLTDWFGNGANIPKTIPPLSWGVAFTVRLGLGNGGPSPTDQVGSVPGQSSTPSTGAPSPGLPGSKVTVNLVDGNVSFSVTTQKLQTVGGGLSLGFTYNSAQIASQALNQGLLGTYYSDTTADENSSDHVGGSGDVQVGGRVDPIVYFDWGQGAAFPAQNPGEAAARWTGSLALPFTGSWALGDISSDGMNITYNGTQQLSDWGPHPVQTAPTFGTTFSATANVSAPITIDWHHSTSAPAVAEIFAEYFGTSPATIYEIPASWLTHPPSTLPGGWTLDSAAGQASWVGLAPQAGSATIFAADGSGYEFAYNGGGVYAPPAQLPNERLSTDSSGNYILDDPDAGLIYTFNPNGQLASVKSAADDLHPAALSYTYSGSPPLLTGITDPVSGRTTTLVYGGGSCPTPPTGYSTAPSNVLCAINFWDGTATDLFYNSSGELAEVAEPDNVVWQFGYDSVGRLTSEMDPLAYQATSPARAPIAARTTLAPR